MLKYYNMSKPGCTYQNNADGTPNPKYVDLLEEDKPISGQKFACISFVSPENILQRREHFFFSEFLRTFEFTKCFEKYTQFLHFLSHKYNLNVESFFLLSWYL